MNIRLRIKNKIISTWKKLFFFKAESCCRIKVGQLKYLYDIPKAIQIKRGTIDDIDILIKVDPDMFGKRKIKKFIHRINKGQPLLMIYYNQNLAGYGWLAFNDFMLSVGHEYKLNSNEAALYDAHTFEKFRGKGVYKSFITYAINTLNEQGFEIIYSNYDVNNEITRKTFNKYGFKDIALYKKYRLFGREINKNMILTLASNF